jgi:hypothetical protein
MESSRSVNALALTQSSRPIAVEVVGGGLSVTQAPRIGFFERMERDHQIGQLQRKLEVAAFEIHVKDTLEKVQLQRDAAMAELRDQLAEQFTVAAGQREGRLRELRGKEALDARRFQMARSRSWYEECQQEKAAILASGMDEGMARRFLAMNDGNLDGGLSDIGRIAGLTS